MPSLPIYTCNPDALLKSSICFLEPSSGEVEREAISLFARVQNLAALGGPNFTGNIAGLLIAMRDPNGNTNWREFSCTQREAIGTYRHVQDAIYDGATFATDINSLKKLATCYLAMGKEDRKNALAFLSCAISTLAKPD